MSSNGDRRLLVDDDEDLRADPEGADRLAGTHDARLSLRASP